MTQTPEDRLNVDPISWEAGQVQPPSFPPPPPTPSGPDGVDDVGPTRPIDIPPPNLNVPPSPDDNPPIIYDPSGRLPGEPGYQPKGSFKPGQPEPPIPLGREASGQVAPTTDDTGSNSMNQ